MWNLFSTYSNKDMKDSRTMKLVLGGVGAPFRDGNVLSSEWQMLLFILQFL